VVLGAAIRICPQLRIIASSANYLPLPVLVSPAMIDCFSGMAKNQRMTGLGGGGKRSWVSKQANVGFGEVVAQHLTSA